MKEDDHLMDAVRCPILSAQGSRSLISNDQRCSYRTSTGHQRLRSLTVQECEQSRNRRIKRTGGEGGIRTLGTGVSPYNGLANRRIRPLCHLSGVRSYSLAWWVSVRLPLQL